MASGRLLRTTGWVVCLAAAVVSGLTFLLAVMIVGYEHSGSSPWPSPWAAVGSALLAGVGPVAAGLGIRHLLERRPGIALALASVALTIPVGWYFVWVALWG